jgi:hypothetical protein
MAKNQTEIVGKSLNKIKDRIKEELSSLGIDYTGRLSESLEVNNTAFGATLSAERYLPTAFDNVGRGPGGNPWIDPDWIRVRGIQPRDFTTGKFITFESLAVLISRKIGREGTNRFTNSGVGSVGVDIDTILEDEKPKLLKKLTVSFAKDMTKSILSISKN